MEVCAPLRAPDGGAGGALRLRLRLRPAHGLQVGPPTFAEVPPHSGGVVPMAAAGIPGGSFASWMSALQEMSASFDAREGFPEECARAR